MEHEREIGSSEVDQTSLVRSDVADAFPIGDVINGRYAVLGRITEGSTGKFYRVQDATTDSEVTLKLLLGWPRLDDAVLAQVGEELSAMRRLGVRRSNIARVLGCDVTPDCRAFVVMERLEGRTLAELIRWREPLSIDRALQLAFQVAEGLRVAHEVGLIHGALSPEHVIVQPDDAVKIVGFEVARLRAALRAASSSPERADALTEASDTQAVGMMLQEMLTSGVRPGPQGVADPNPDAPRGGDIPIPVKQLVMQTLVKTTGATSYGMGALARALSTELTRRAEPASSRAWRRARPRPKPSRLQWALVGLAVAVTALVGWAAWSFIFTPAPAVTHEVPVLRAQPTTPSPSSEGTAPSQPADGAPLASPQPVAVTGADSSAPQASTSPIPPPTGGAVPPPAPAPAVRDTPPPLPSPARPDTVGPTPPRNATPAPASDARAPKAPVPAVPPPAPAPAVRDTPPPLPPPARPDTVGPTPPRDATPAPASDARAQKAPVPPRESVRPAPARAGGAARSASDAPDPSAIIDWLIKSRGGSPEEP
jgi:serine/threonine-protein kinase